MAYLDLDDYIQGEPGSYFFQIEIIWGRAIHHDAYVRLEAKLEQAKAALHDYDNGHYDGQNGRSAFINRLRAALEGKAAP